MIEPFIIDETTIDPGENKRVSLFVSRLPSGNAINIVSHVFRSKNPGPTVLIMGGIHGDEINGIQIIRRILEEGILDNLLVGSVIAIPLLNVFGFINYQRGLPDGKDVNRSFPGSPLGSLASRTANSLTKKLLPIVDIAIDLHTGGGSRYNYPQIRYSRSDIEGEKLGRSFGAPFLIEKGYIARSFRKIANQMGIPVLVYEAGESVRLDGFAIELGVAGIKRTLKALNMIEDAPDAQMSTKPIMSTSWVRSSEAGLFTWTRQSGCFVRKGEQLGVIHSPYGDEGERIYAKRDGYIIGHNNASVVHHGDALFHIGYS